VTDSSAPSHVNVGAARSSPKTLGGIFRRAGGGDRWTHLTRGLPDGVQDVYAIACG